MFLNLGILLYKNDLAKFVREKIFKYNEIASPIFRKLVEDDDYINVRCGVIAGNRCNVDYVRS